MSTITTKDGTQIYYKDWVRAMRTYSPGRGRKKAVQRFPTGEGLWMVGVVAAAMIGMVLLGVPGILNVNAG